jgi:hypothetical protein
MHICPYAALKSEEQKDSNLLYPVITFVLYFGEKEWTYPTNLVDCVNLERLPKELHKYVSDYKIHVFDIPRMSPEQVNQFRSDFKIVADFFVQERIQKENGSSIPYLPSEQDMDHEEAVIEFFRSMTGDMRFLEALNQKGRKENVEKNMSQVIDYYLEKGKEEGKEEGIQQEKKDNAISLATNGVDLQVISNCLHVSVEQIKQWVQEAEAA